MKMFRWFSKAKPADQVSLDLTNARAFLPKLRLKLDTGGPPTMLSYRQGLAEVCRSLAYAHRVPIPDVLAARVTADQATRISRDLGAALAKCQAHLNDPNEAARALAETFLAGCTMFSHLYRMRLHELTAPDAQQAEAGRLAQSYANVVQTLLQGSRP